jgi:hypothetical protein
MMLSITNSIIGADLALFKAGGRGMGAIALNEAKLSEYLDTQLVENGGLITKYGFLS